jgi:hypothetical protein
MFGSLGRSWLPLAFVLGQVTLAHAQSSAPVAEKSAPVAEPEPANAGAAPARAQELFNEAAKLTGEGKFVEACAKLEESYGLYAGMGTAFNLARCWQKIGRTASAYALFETVIRKTREAGQEERAVAAQAKLAALLPKLSRLRIDVDRKKRAPNTIVKKNGEIVAESDWEKPLAVDPATYELEVSADGKTTWTQRVEVKEPGMTVVVTVPELAEAPKPVPVVAAKASQKPKPKPAPAPVRQRRGGHTGLGMGSAAVGAIGISAAIFKTVEYYDKNGQAKDVCPTGTNCTPGEIASHESLVSEAKQARNWSYVGYAVGAVGFLSAGYFLFLAPNQSEAPKVGSLRATPLVAPDSFGATLEGSF